MKIALSKILFILVMAACMAGAATFAASEMSSAGYKTVAISMNGGGNVPFLTDGGSFRMGTSTAQEMPVGKWSSTNYVNASGLWYFTPDSSLDTDGDGIPDDIDDDDDNDGLLDSVETDTGIYIGPTDTGTDPLNPDTDGDTYNDGIEVTLGSDPNISTSVPNYEPGDIAPRGAPDGVVDVADSMLAMRMASDLITPTPVEVARGDVTPLSNPDGTLDISDALLIMRKASGLTSF